MGHTSSTNVPSYDVPTLTVAPEIDFEKNFDDVIPEIGEFFFVRFKTKTRRTLGNMFSRKFKFLASKSVVFIFARVRREAKRIKRSVL